MAATMSKGLDPGHNSPHALLRPFQISLRLSSHFDAFREVRANSLQPTLSEGLQFQKLSLLGVQLAGTVISIREPPVFTKKIPPSRDR